MKNVIELLADRLPDACKAIESALMEKYAIKELGFSVGNGPFRYQFQCTDAVNDFITSYDDDYQIALDGLIARMTPRGKVAKQMRAKAAQLLKEAELA